MENTRTNSNQMVENLIMEIYGAQEVGDSFLGRKFTENEKIMLQAGKTLHWKNIDIGGEEKRDMNIKMDTYVNTKGQLEKGMSVQLKAKKLEIPDKILDKKLNTEEKEALTKGMFFCVEREDKKFLVKIDQKINSVIIRVPRELGIKEELGGYQFSKDELARLSNSHEVGPKVFHSEKHGYFVSNLSIKDEGLSMEYKYSNIINISKKEAEQLKPFLNANNGELKDNEINKVLDIMGAGKKDDIKESLTSSIKNGKEVKEMKVDKPDKSVAKKLTTPSPSMKPGNKKTR